MNTAHRLQIYKDTPLANLLRSALFALALLVEAEIPG